ncbi:tetratricopeptide repeat protein [bacterium]|nr:tetratricopeptide repeat protein [bacterium]
MRWLILLFCLMLVFVSSCGPKDSEKAKELLMSGTMKYDNGDYEGAIADFNEALKYDRKISNIWLQRGMTKFALKDTDGAIKDYSKAIKLVPCLTYAYVERANVYFILGEYDKAEKDALKALEVNPEMESALQILEHIKDVTKK